MQKTAAVIQGHAGRELRTCDQLVLAQKLTGPRRQRQRTEWLCNSCRYADADGLLKEREHAHPKEKVLAYTIYLVSFVNGDRPSRNNVHTKVLLRDFARERSTLQSQGLLRVASDGIFRVITSSPTTADMTVMTPGGLAVFYPHWTLNKIALASHRITRANLDGQEQGNVCPSVGCTGKSVFSVERTTHFLGELCGVMSPLWRINSAEDFDGSLERQ
ncbi:hypothetical protein DFJ58DRAFT_853253 [Suillus subalutaceus]|uniref:uncharacterized protein n=1 Tax=Suillus subalutaceus TaxID=48586 RepID=UPI001B863139|nr:uncharacterized protein DFJ58DRAFT_853253 [Suillus subalutaceus]KAG1844044.1 hypothetical protein DFJ58DRAFT_853253 [Suillus subalutaceus]